jgi:iron(III) transport system substrate-binding protein
MLAIRSLTKRTPGLLAGLAVGILLVVSACGTGSDTDTAEGGTVTIYSGRNEDLMASVLEDFTAETGIEVQVNYGESDALAALIAEEGESSPADIFLSQSPGAVGFLDQAGLLADLPDDVLERVPATVRDDDGRWVGISGRQRVLVYHPDRVSAEELPDSVLELTGPEWADRLGVAPANGSFQDFVTAMRFELGDDDTKAWLEGLVANGAVSYAKNSAIVEAVARGEVDAGLVNHYYNFRAIDENPDHPALNHQFATDDLGSLLIVTAAAKLDSSENHAAVDALLEFLLSESAQRYFADETFEYPLVDGVAPAAMIPPASFSDVGSLDLEELEGGLAATRELINSSGFDG